MQHGMSLYTNGGDPVSPVISGCLVTQCKLRGIWIRAEGLGGGSPVLSSTEVSFCGHGVSGSPCAGQPLPLDGSGATFFASLSRVLTPSVSGCIFSNNKCDGLVLRIDGSLFAAPPTSAKIQGSVSNCRSTQNGDDGFEILLFPSAPEPGPQITTEFRGNRGDSNAGTLVGEGLSIRAANDPNNPSDADAAVRTKHFNDLYDGNSGDGVCILAEGPVVADPLFAYLTVRANGGIGVNYAPGTISGPPTLSHSTVTGNGGGDVSLSLDNYVMWSNYLIGPPLGLTNTDVPPDFTSDYHLTLAAPNPCKLIDMTPEVPGYPVLDIDGQARVYDHPLVGPCTGAGGVSDKGIDEVHG